MYRFLLAPRWWAINAFVVLAIPFCLFMGTWQLGRFEHQVDGHREHQEQAEAVRSAEAVPLDTLLPPTTDTVGQVAEVRGVYDDEHELLVPRRTLESEHGTYVLTPLVREDGGTAVPVVRGWLPGDPDPEEVPAPPAGTVTVEGVLQAEESPMDVAAPTGLPAGQLGVISAASLINVLPYEVENSWLTVREAHEPLVAVPPVAPTNTGLDAKAFQNLGYTAEWFAFAAFALFMWYRFFRRELEAQRDSELGLDDGPSSGAAGAGRALRPTGTEPSPAGAGAPAAATGTPEPVGRLGGHGAAGAGDAPDGPAGSDTSEALDSVGELRTVTGAGEDTAGIDADGTEPIETPQPAVPMPRSTAP